MFLRCSFIPGGIVTAFRLPLDRTLPLKRLEFELVFLFCLLGFDPQDRFG